MAANLDIFWGELIVIVLYNIQNFFNLHKRIIFSKGGLICMNPILI